MAKSNEQWVTDLYKTSMGREPDQKGLDYWTKQLDDRGEDRKDFISKYFHGHDDAKAFRNNPQPDPTPTEDYTGYVEGLYADILGRGSDESGLKYWTDALTAGTSTKDDVRKGFAYSDESKTNIANLYRDLLERDITSSGTDEFSTNEIGETDASYWLREGLYDDKDGSFNNLFDVEKNIKLSDEYLALQASKNKPKPTDPVDGDKDGDGIISDGEVPGITASTLDDINKRIDDIIAKNGGTDIDAITKNVLNKLNTDTGGVGLTGTGGTGSGNLAAGTLDQTNNEAIKALIDTIVNDKTKDIKSTDLTGVLDKIAGVKGDLTKLQGDFSGLNTSTDFTGAENLAAIKSVLDAEGYTEQLTNLDTTYSNKINDLKTTLTNLTGGNQAAIAGLQSDLQSASGANLAAIAGLQGDIASAAAKGKADVADLKKAFEKNELGVTNLSGELARLVLANDDLAGKFNDLNIDVTDLSGDFDAKLGLLKEDLTSKTGAKFDDVQSKYNATQNSIRDLTHDLSSSSADLEGKINAASATSALNLADAKLAWQSKLHENMQTTSNNFTNLSTDVNSKLSTFSDEQSKKFADVYKSREDSISELRTDWGNKLQKQEAGLQARIQGTADNINERLTNISSNMNYRMLGDSAAGIKMRRSKAFNTGRTSKGTGQLNRSMRIQTLNL